MLIPSVDRSRAAQIVQWIGSDMITTLGCLERSEKKRITKHASASLVALAQRKPTLLVRRVNCCELEPEPNRTSENEDSTAVSRASSVSAKDKTAFGKRGKTGKQRRDDAESFDDRSKYTAYYHPQHTTWVQPQYVPVGTASFGAQQMPQQPYPNAMQPVYAASNPPYQQLMTTNGYAPQVNNMPQVSVLKQPKKLRGGD